MANEAHVEVSVGAKLAEHGPRASRTQQQNSIWSRLECDLTQQQRFSSCPVIGSTCWVGTDLLDLQHHLRVGISAELLVTVCTRTLFVKTLVVRCALSVESLVLSLGRCTDGGNEMSSQCAVQYITITSRSYASVSVLFSWRF